VGVLTFSTVLIFKNMSMLILQLSPQEEFFVVYASNKIS